MILPLITAVFINTVFPAFFTFGSYSGVFLSNQGMITLMCLTLLYTCCQLDIRDLPQAVKRGGSHVLFNIWQEPVSIYSWHTTLDMEEFCW